MTTTVTDHAPFRADQVGSLLRPPELKIAREQHAKGEISDADLRAVEDRLIRIAAKKQESVGLQAITDGDFRRQSWSSDFLCAIGGVVQAPPSGPRQPDTRRSRNLCEAGGQQSTREPEPGTKDDPGNTACR